MEEYIKAGLILRENKRYYLNLPMLEYLDNLELDQEIFVREASPVYQALSEQSFETELRNQTNAAILVEKDRFCANKNDLVQLFLQGQKSVSFDRKTAGTLCHFGRCQS